MNSYDYIVYKTTEIYTGKIYIGYDSYNRDWYYGSGRYFLNRIYKVIKEYYENILNEHFVDEKKYQTFYKRYKEIVPLFFTKEILQHYTTMEEMSVCEEIFIELFDATNKSIGYNITKKNWGGDNFTNNPYKEEIREVVGRKSKEYWSNEINILKRKEFWAKEENRLKQIENGKKCWENKEFRENQIKKAKEYWTKEENRLKSSIALKKAMNKEYIKQNMHENNPMKKLMGKKHPCATKYIIETPDHNIIEFIGQKDIIDYLGCSYAFFRDKKYKEYKLLNKIKINKK